MRQDFQLQREEAARQRIEIRNPIPLVMIVFDEFSGTSLMNERLEIDAARYPNFARPWRTTSAKWTDWPRR